MGEVFEKLDANTLKITTVVAENKELSKLEADLKMAKDSLDAVNLEYARRIADIQVTVDLMQKRVNEAKNLGIVAKIIVVK